MRRCVLCPATRLLDSGMYCCYTIVWVGVVREHYVLYMIGRLFLNDISLKWLIFTARSNAGHLGLLSSKSDI